ncbi:MAG: hypothetical protein ACR2I5_00715 [Candidatus Limnocylindria bacterium]
MRFATTALLAVLVAGCNWLVDPARTCSDQAVDYGSGVEVSGAFVTTAARVRSLYPNAAQMIPEAEEPDHALIVLCYLDGALPKGPPPTEDGQPPPSFDRAVIAVVGETGIPLTMGYQEHIRVADPNE